MVSGMELTRASRCSSDVELEDSGPAASSRGSCVHRGARVGWSVCFPRGYPATRDRQMQADGGGGGGGYLMSVISVFRIGFGKKRAREGQHRAVNNNNNNNN